MRIVYDLIAWESIFLGSVVGLVLTAIMSLVRIARHRPVGPVQRLMLFVFAVGTIVPWLSVPRFGARFQRGMQTNVVMTTDTAELPELRPRHYEEPLLVVHESVLNALQLLRWPVVSQDESTIRAEVPVKGGIFTDDMVISLAADDSRTIINVRSNSRVGRGDLGENRRHIVQLFTVLDEQLAARQ